MDKKNAVLKDIGSFKAELEKHMKIKRMLLFGSFAYGKPHKYSDIDLIVVSDSFRGQKTFSRGVEFYKYWKLNKPVDFLCYTTEEFEKLRKQVSIVSKALKEGIEIN